MTSLDENPNCARTYATFRLAGDNLNPDEATAALAISPSRALRKGQQIREQRRAGRIQRTGVCLLGTEDKLSSTSLEQHLVYLLDVIEPASAALDRLRGEQQIRARFLLLLALGHRPWRP